MIAHDPRIASVIMFGRHRIDPGILVEPAAGYEVPDDDSRKLEEFVSAIWYVLRPIVSRFPQIFSPRV